MISNQYEAMHRDIDLIRRSNRDGEDQHPLYKESSFDRSHLCHPRENLFNVIKTKRATCVSIDGGRDHNSASHQQQGS